MNHLAHALLAGDDDALILGGLLGDFVHGPVPDTLPPRVADGLRLHRAVDVFTDAHPAVLAAKAVFAPPLRRYAGILLDVWFDHVLANDFACWSSTPLAVFSARINAVLATHTSLLPQALRRFAVYMAAHGLPATYADPAEIERALHGISLRLRRANPVADAMPDLHRCAPPLRDAFDVFFPQLIAYATQWRHERGYL